MNTIIYDNKVKIHVKTWRPIPNFPGYLVSSDGQIVSFNPGRWKDRPTQIKPRILKPWHTRDGYAQVQLGQKKVYVHRLVLQTFAGFPPSQDHVTDHLDFVRNNNDINNLRWLPRNENARRKAPSSSNSPNS